MTISESDRAYVEELRTRVELGGATGERSSRPVMDSCRSGLEFFRLFGPAYAAYTRTPFNFQRDIVARYEKEGDIAFGRLRADADRFGDTGERLTDNVINLRNAGNPIFEAWQGAAASAARGMFGGMLSGTDGVREQFARLRGVLLAAVDAVDRAMFEKAAGVLELHATAVGGVSAEEVSFLVGLGRCAEADHWLTTVFVPFYQARVARFDALCDATERAVTAAWAGLETALRDIHTDHYAGMTGPPAPGVDRTTPSPRRPEPLEAGQPEPLEAGQPEPLEAGQHAAVDTMLPASATPIVAPVAVQLAPAGSGGGGSTFYGAPFYGGVASSGGGDRDHKRTVPLAADPFWDATPAPDTETALIGADPEDAKAEPDSDDELW